MEEYTISYIEKEVGTSDLMHSESEWNWLEHPEVRSIPIPLSCNDAFLAVSPFYMWAPCL